MLNFHKRMRFVMLCALTGILTLPVCGFADKGLKGWPNNQGELCWETTRDGEDEPHGLVRLGITKIFGGHYIVAGVATGSSGDGIPYTSIIHGNAEILGDSITMTIVGSERDVDALRTGIFHVILDASTLNGEQENIGHEYYYPTGGDGSVTPGYEKGSLQLIRCP